MGDYDGYINPLIYVTKDNVQRVFTIESYSISETSNYACLVNDTPSELPKIPEVSYSSAVFNGVESTFGLPEGWSFRNEGESDTEYPISNYGKIQP